MNKENLIKLINDCFDSVNESKAGPIMSKKEDGSTELHSVGYNTFLYLLNSLSPKNVSANMTMKEAGDNWKNPDCDNR